MGSINTRLTGRVTSAKLHGRSLPSRRGEVLRWATKRRGAVRGDCMEAREMKAPFPYFGGKSKVADLVWSRFGDTVNYVEPFAGSLAVLLKRPYKVRTETINDKDCYVSNFWRALGNDPEEVAHYADWPVNEADLHARHLWLINQVEFRERMMTDPDYYDAKIAGWWVWGISAWIGSGWCSAERYNRHSGIRVDGTTERKRPEMHWRGVHRANIARKVRHFSGSGQGINRVSNQKPHLSGDSGATGSGIHASAFERKNGSLMDYMIRLHKRLRRVRVCCGDWSRICGPSPTYHVGMTAVFLDPPYTPDERQSDLYATDDRGDKSISEQVRKWCIEEVNDKKFVGPRYLHPKMRIALCGYEGEGHEVLEGLGWDVVAWKANGGYSNQNRAGNENRKRERIWFSPNCLQVEAWTQGGLP